MGSPTEAKGKKGGPKICQGPCSSSEGSCFPRLLYGKYGKYLETSPRHYVLVEGYKDPVERNPSSIAAAEQGEVKGKTANKGGKASKGRGCLLPRQLLRIGQTLWLILGLQT